MLDLALRLFAHLIGEKPWYLEKMFSDRRMSRQVFMEYVPERQRWVPTKASHVYSAVKQYWEEFADSPSVDSVIDIIEGLDIRDTHKSAVVTWLKDLGDSTVSEAEFQFLVKELHVLYIKSKAAEISLNLLTEVEDDPLAAIRNVVDAANSVPMAATTSTGLAGVCTAKDLAKALLLEMRGEVVLQSYLPFPWPRFNKELTGLGVREVTSILGRYSSGKSYLLKEIAYHAAETSDEDEVVFLFDNEMSEMQIFRRLIARVSGLPITKIVQNKLTKSERTLYKQVASTLYKTPAYNRLIFVGKREFDTVKDIKRHMVTLAKGRRIRAFFVDHIGKLRYTTGSVLDHQNVKDCLITLGEYAHEFDTACALIGHLNRDDQVQFQSVLDLSDLALEVHQSTLRPGQEPNNEEGDWLGKTTQLDVIVKRARTQASGSTFYLDALFSTSSIRETPKAKIAYRSNKVRALARKNGSTR